MTPSIATTTPLPFHVNIQPILIMADLMTPEQRRRCMSAIKGRDTRPEMIVRRYLFARGLRYRVNDRRLPGSPDIVFPKYKTVVFIDGCFWHGHEGCRHFHLPKTNADFWRHKINMNIARDYANNVDLRLAGWRVIRVWECRIRPKAGRDIRLDALYRLIVSGDKMAGVPYAIPDDASIAAEPEAGYKSGKNLSSSSDDMPRRDE